MNMKILIVRLSSLGDIILTQPVIAWLQAKYPRAELHFLTKEQFKDLPLFFAPLEHEIKVILYEKTLAFHQSLAISHYDIVIDLQDKFSSMLIRLFTASAKHYTYDKQHLLRRAIIKHKTDKAISSTVSLYFSALAKMSKEVTDLHPANPILYSEHFLSTQSTQLNTPPDKTIIAMFPGAAHRTKMYPPQLFIRLIELLSEKYFVLLLGDRREHELCLLIHLAEPRKTVNLAGAYTLTQLVSMINQANVIITNDSGPMHIAAALDKPQIALFGATTPRLGFAPLNKKAIVFCQNLPCQPCSLHGQEACPRRHFACLLSVKPEAIKDAIISLENA